MVTLLKWTVPDYHHLIEQGLLEGKKVELLDGNLVTMAPEGPLHSYTTNTVADYLRQNLHGLAVVREAHLPNPPHHHRLELLEICVGHKVFPGWSQP